MVLTPRIKDIQKVPAIMTQALSIEQKKNLV